MLRVFNVCRGKKRPRPEKNGKVASYSQENSTRVGSPSGFRMNYSSVNLQN